MHRLLGRGGSIGRFSQSMLLQVPAQLGEDQLIATVQALLDHHDALRLRLVRFSDSAQWSLEVAPPGTIMASACVRRIDVSALDEPMGRACIPSRPKRPRLALSPRPG